jgi:NAD(P)-dependent dehydrogenase (short-subunit alcohol dehydrogenase family)
MSRPIAAAARVALVTGCSSGIGRATALHLRRVGWTVYATARRPETLSELSAAGCHTHALDVNDESSMREVVSTIEASHGSVGALVNNAAYSQSGAIEVVPMDRVRAQFETNVFGPSRLIQLVLPGMRRALAGRIVNVSSMGGKLVFPGGGYYHATKFALEAISDALRFEVQGFGVDVIVIEPGLIRSGFGAAAVATVEGPGAMPAALASTYGEFQKTVARVTKESYEKGSLAPLAGTPEDVARVIARALDARRPRTRYTVSPSATFLLTLRRCLSDRLWDRFVARSFPVPE